MSYKPHTLTDCEFRKLQMLFREGYSADYVRSQIGFSYNRWKRARLKYPILDNIIKSSFKKQIGFVPRSE
jgi:hypothetical protein